MNIYAITIYAHHSAGVIFDSGTFLIDGDSDENEQTNADALALRLAQDRFISPAYHGHVGRAKRLSINQVRNLADMVRKVLNQ